ncbi:hypothetical protein AX16_002080 [Volvariella volvacea WC 439]|nr:hypothetical protein AX16_002080 [Volvariella volvacea WC 439]
MNHGDHGGHGEHGDMPMGPKCVTHMLWNAQIIDTCVIFQSWHIGSHFQFILSCLVIIGLGILYEYLRLLQRQVDLHIARSLAKGKAKSRSSSRGRNLPENELEESGLLSGRRKEATGSPVPPVFRILRATLYGLSVFLSFFLMLIFMTYNVYLILATVLGAALGHYIFGSTLDVSAILNGEAGTRALACH